MSHFSRRSFLKSGAAIPFSLWFEKYAAGQIIRRPPLIRYNVMSTQGQAMLGIYRSAVQSMMNTAEPNPTGWLFQWYTHWVRGDRTKAAEIARVYPSPSAWQSLAQDMWSTCQAHGGGDENFFLPWHRMYVYFLERIVRKVSGVTCFTLPYWNYSDTSSPSGPRLPDGFINPGNTTNPLWRQNRKPGPNAGQPIDQGLPDTPLGLTALNQCSYKPNGAAQGFCATLDFGLHGTVHVQIGNSQGMGSVPWAGNDPIFWMHHCNIDRLWASWNTGPNARTNPTDASWLGQTFVFADENGNKVVAKVQDFDAISKLGYTYDHFESLSRCLIIKKPPVLRVQQLFTLPEGPVTLEAGPKRILLKTGLPKTGAMAGPPPSLSASVQGLKASEQLYLVLRDLSANTAPGVLYNVYLNLPEGTKPESSETNYVGSINFFDAVGHHEHATEQPSRFVSFDISELAKKLQSSGGLGEEASVTIVPAGEPESDAKPVIGQISLVKQ
jgi:tyrosinase